MAAAAAAAAVCCAVVRAEAAAAAAAAGGEGSAVDTAVVPAAVEVSWTDGVCMGGAAETAVAVSAIMPTSSCAVVGSCWWNCCCCDCGCCCCCSMKDKRGDTHEHTRTHRHLVWEESSYRQYRRSWGNRRTPPGFGLTALLPDSSFSCLLSVFLLTLSNGLLPLPPRGGGFDRVKPEHFRDRLRQPGLAPLLPPLDVVVVLQREAVYNVQYSKTPSCLSPRPTSLQPPPPPPPWLWAPLPPPPPHVSQHHTGLWTYC